MHKLDMFYTRGVENEHIKRISYWCSIQYHVYIG